MVIVQRVLVLFWALASSLLTLFYLGFSHFFSFVFGVAHISTVVNVSFIILTVFYAMIFRILFKKNMSFIVIFLVFLPPLLVFWGILFS